jgi:hypothetical protein
MGRLNTPDESVGKDYVIGVKGTRYFAPTLKECDRHIQFLTLRIRRWAVSEKNFDDLVEVLTEDRDLLLSRRLFLMIMADEAKEPA